MSPAGSSKCRNKPSEPLRRCLDGCHRRRTRRTRNRLGMTDKPSPPTRGLEIYDTPTAATATSTLLRRPSSTSLHSSRNSNQLSGLTGSGTNPRPRRDELTLPELPEQPLP
jgi:hypothetical protein